MASEWENYSEIAYWDTFPPQGRINYTLDILSNERKLFEKQQATKKRISDILNRSLESIKECRRIIHEKSYAFKDNENQNDASDLTNFEESPVGSKDAIFRPCNNASRNARILDCISSANEHVTQCRELIRRSSESEREVHLPPIFVLKNVHPSSDGCEWHRMQFPGREGLECSPRDECGGGGSERPSPRRGVSVSSQVVKLPPISGSNPLQPSSGARRTATRTRSKTTGSVDAHLPKLASEKNSDSSCPKKRSMHYWSRLRRRTGTCSLKLRKP